MCIRDRDTKGPEIRLKNFKNGKVTLKAGQTFTLTTRDVEGDEKICSITYKELPQDLTPGARVLLDDGLVGMKVDAIQGRTTNNVNRNKSLFMVLICL